MLSFIHRIEKKHIGWLINTLVFSFFITVLTFKKGYSYAPMTLAIIGVIYLFYYLFVEKRKLNATKEDKWLIFAFVFYFSTFALSAVIHGDGWREIDNPSRVLLFLPLLLLFREFPIDIRVILHGISFGSAIAGITAIYQRFYLDWYVAFVNSMSIQSGDIAISLAMMSFAIAIYWGIKKEYKFLIFSLLCSFAGILASGLSGARGGWIGIPIILTLILYFAYKKLSKKFVIVMSSSIFILIMAITLSSQTNILNRIKIAQDEFVSYVESNNKNTSVGARLDMWQSGLLGIKEKPLLGWGKDQYIFLKKQQLEQGIIAPSTYSFNDAHNQYIDTFVKRGLIGFLGLLNILLIPLFYFFKQFIQNDMRVKIVGLIGLVHILSVIFFSITQSFFAHNSGSIFYFFVVILLYRVAEGLKK
ncbi:hypothetical protein A1D29_02735 [Pasteurellaceae bacterium Orientalotternb1]|nr:hypothetical protein A1D29_02735 [Pasteurellaceae bacterium Orientalotternb1]